MGKNLALAIALILALGAFFFLLEHQAERGTEGLDASPVAQPGEVRGKRARDELPSPEPAVEDSPSNERIAANRSEELIRREASEAEPEQALIQGASLRVQVVDARGQPLENVPVVIERFDSDGSSRKPAFEYTKGRDGIAVFSRVERHLAKVEKTTYRVVADIVSLELVHAALDPIDLPTDPIVLQLPPTGSVRVRVLDTDWDLVTHDARVTLECIPAGEAKEVSLFSATRRRKVKVDSDAGVALFPHVEVGLELGGEAKRGGAQAGSRAYGPGPLRVGEVANLDIFMGADHPVVRFRPVRADGKSFGIGTFFCTLQMHTEISHNNSTTYPEVDDQGRVLVDLTNDWQAGKSRYLSVEYRGGFKPFPTGGIDLSRELQNGINDFGDVILGEPQVFVSGRVVSEDGAGLPNAKLRLNSKGKGSVHWGGHWDFQVQTEGDGTFKVTQPIAGDTFRISAEKPGYACGWTEFKSGDQELTIVMRSEGQVAGSVLVDEGIPHEMILVRIDSLGDGLENLGGQPLVDLDENGMFLFKSLMPGSRRMVVRAKWQTSDLAVFEDVIVVSGEVCRDPRLQQIDLRGRLNLHTIEFLGVEEGQPTGGTLNYGPHGAAELEGRRWFVDGPVQLTTPEESLDVFVHVNGYRPVFLEDVRGTVQVQLRSGPKVVLVLTGDGELPKPPHYLKAGLAPVDAENFTVDWRGDAFDERREAKICAPHEGRMQVEWMLERRSPNTSIGSGVSLEQKQIVEVLDVEGEQRIEVRLNAAEMKELLGGLP